MANWCTNTLRTLDGAPMGSKFSKYINADKFDFEKIIPLPPIVKIAMLLSEFSIKRLELPDTTKAVLQDLVDSNSWYETKAALQDLVDSNSWYDWCVKNWGTRSVGSVIDINEESVTFSTAWRPPIPVIEALSKLLNIPLRMTYVEEGMEICGEITCSAGVTTGKCYDKFADVPKELRDELGLSEGGDEEDEEEDEEDEG